MISTAVAAAPFTLINAPAGFGKTVLASTWAASQGRDRPTAWLTVTDPHERPTVFWSQVCRALAAVLDRPIEANAFSPSSCSLDDVVDLLDGTVTPVVLVIDAADRLRKKKIFDQLGQLLESAGDAVRLVMTSRTDPPLPLHRYRLEGTIAEVRPDELLFNFAEAGRLLELHGLTISTETVQKVIGRTDGWAAGVRMAALALRDGPDHVPLDDLAGDYLVAEVLSELTRSDRDFLRALSVLDQIPPGLGAQVTGRFEADELLRQLSVRHLFVAPGRGEAGSYRIHPLLRTVLNRDLAAQPPIVLAELHRRIADWFATQGQPVKVIQHAAAGGDWIRAAHIVLSGDLVADLLLSTSRGAEVTQHLHGMPDLDSTDVRLVRTAVAVGLGKFESARANLALRVTDDELMSEDWHVASAVVRTWLNAVSGRPTETLVAAAAARDQLTAEARRSGGRLTMLEALVLNAEGIAHLHTGNFDTACDKLREATITVAAEDCRDFRSHCLATFALAEVCRDHLSQAQQLADAAQQLTGQLNPSPKRLPIAVPLVQAWVALQRHDLARAQDLLRRCDQLLRAEDDILARGILTLLRARLDRDQGNLLAARTLLERPQPLDWLRTRRDAEAAALGLHVDSPELAPSTAAPATGIRSGPSHQIDRAAQRVGGRLGAARGSSSRRATNRNDDAAEASLAARRQIRRPLPQPPPGLRSIRSDGEPRSRARGSVVEPASSVTTRPSPAPTVPQMTETLSMRELEVLELLSALFNTEEIAAALFISPNTVRTHVRRIMEKLDVSRRSDAVRRARGLNLL